MSDICQRLDYNGGRLGYAGGPEASSPLLLELVREEGGVPTKLEPHTALWRGIHPPLRHSQRFLIAWSCSWPSWRVRSRVFAIAFFRDRRCELWVASPITRVVTNI